MTILLIFLIILFVINVWFMCCNNRTLKQRLSIINTRSHNWDDATYGKHLWYLFTFRNPYNLYRKF